MTRLMLRLGALVLSVALTCSADEWLLAVNIKLEPPDDGQQIVNVCFKPAQSVAYDQVVFECVYRQQFTWTDSQGHQALKTLEPVAFTYRRAPVNMVADLDCHVSFRAPVSYQRLAEGFGTSTFATNAPIVINRLRIRGERGGACLWRQELSSPGDHVIAATPPPAAPSASSRTPPKSGKFGEVDLD